MAIGIVEWGGLDTTIALPLFLSIVGLLGLLIALVAVSSQNPFFGRLAGLSASAIGCVTLLFLIEFLFFRTAGQSLLEMVPVFGANVPLIVLYAFSLVASSAEVVTSTIRIQQLKVPR
jgi:hypothetical protein